MGGRRECVRNRRWEVYVRFFLIVTGFVEVLVEVLIFLKGMVFVLLRFVEFF